jgi:hypothetical protein
MFSFKKDSKLIEHLQVPESYYSTSFQSYESSSADKGVINCKGVLVYPWGIKGKSKNVKN